MPLRLTDSFGNQIVSVDRYSYVWRGDEPLKVGDRVRLPGGMGLGPWEGEVTALGTNYQGKLTDILDRAD